MSPVRQEEEIVTGRRDDQENHDCSNDNPKAIQFLDLRLG
jgi:hypothetical protein